MHEYYLGMMTAFMIVGIIILLIDTRRMKKDINVLDLVDTLSKNMMQAMSAIMDVMMDNVERIKVMEEKLGIVNEEDCTCDGCVKPEEPVDETIPEPEEVTKKKTTRKKKEEDK